MKRRDFSIHLATAGLGLAAAGVAQAQGGPVEGTHYVRLSTPAPVSLAAGKKVEVLEFFWYECPACNAFQPTIEPWIRRLPPEVQFRRVPVGFTARHTISAKIYYALEEMGLLETMHKRVFAAIHQQNRRLLTEPEMIAFVNANGGDGNKFGEIYRSFQVATKANRARQTTQDYRIDGVPMLGVSGRFYTSPSLAGGYDRALAVAEFLMQRARQG